MDQYGLAASGERDGLWDWDLVSNRVHFSPRWISMVGCEDGEVGTSPEEWLERVHAEDQARVRRDIETHLGGGASDFEIQHRMRQRNGTYRWMTCRGVVVRDSCGAAVRLVGSHADVTTDHVADPLTGLPNRLLFLDRLTRLIERAGRNQGFLYAVLLIDLDPLVAGDPAGQAGSDSLVTASARRLESCLRGTEPSPFPANEYFVARLRGAQFGLLLDGLKRAGEAQAAADRVLAALLAPVQLRGRQVFPRASIGIAVSATGYTRAEDVTRDADAALHRAMSLGGNRCETFDTDLLQSADARLEVEADLEQALERREFLLFYQPVLEAASSRIVGLEALVRWQHPTRGMISPLDFIPIAEETGFIVPLGNWILREACRQLKAWQEELPIAKDVWVSVNLSSVQFRQSGLVEWVGDALRDVGLEPPCLMLELTESVVMKDPSAAKTLLMQLRVMGVRVGIDDFGTGHSSFAYLHQFPADFLKVDQSFIRGMEANQDKTDIVGAVAGLAGQLGLRVIAEGIESEAGMGLVRSRSCGYVQGFLFSRPVAADAAADLLRNGVPYQIGPRSDNERPLPDPAARQRLPEVPKRKGLRSRTAYLSLALAAVGLFVSVGLTVRVTRGPAPAAPGPSSPSAAVEVRSASAVAAQPPAVEARSASAVAAQSPPVKVRSASAVAAEPPPQTTKPQPPQPTVVTFAVEHRHVFGSCRGDFRVSSSGVSFASDNAKDSFSFNYSQFQSALGDDTLTIKSDQKTYRFRAANNNGKDENLAQLRKVLNAISAFRPK